MKSIPFNKPHCSGNELAYIEEAIQRGHLSGGGHFTKCCEAFLENQLCCPRVLITPSCTAALELSALLLGIQPGTEVIVPAYTFVSTANAFALFGAKIVLADIEPETLNLDPSAVAALLTENTRAIVPIHYGGVSADMDALRQVVDGRSVEIVEDAAQAIGSKWRGSHLGTLGKLGCLSFHETKNIICGEGGALLINDEAMIDQAEILREKGTNRSKFFKGQVDKYTWCDVGSSYLTSELATAYLFAQLESYDEIQERRHTLYDRYYAGFSDLAEAGKVRLPKSLSRENANAHLFYLLLDHEAQRDAFIQHMSAQGVMCVFHYVPLHISDVGERFGYKAGDFPVAEAISQCLVRLPMYVDLSDDEQRHVINSAVKFWS